MTTQFGVTPRPTDDRPGAGVARGGTEPLRIASVPSTHVYVRHLRPPEGPSPFVHLPDPDPDHPSRPATSKWWPPVMLRPEWAATADFDVFHVQFGFDACSPQDLERLVEVLRERGKPLVLTAHDLRNPHHPTRELHDEQLGVLVRAADAVVTLTEGAAAEIRRRWGREALVVPHPHVVELDTMARLRRERAGRPTDEFRVGVHIKSLRESMDPFPVLRVLDETLAELPGGVLQVNGHHDVLDAEGARREPVLAAWLEERAAHGRVDLRVHDFLPDAQLWEYLASLDVAVLPYRFGTHSGWLEACRDLGTTVVAPTCGHYADQGPVLSYGFDESHFDAESLRAAIRFAHAARPDHGVSVQERRAQRVAVAQAHARLYRELLS
ncbi:glycosyltransferase family protein [Aeromicrobium choanae]|uniref:Glycosyltransferase Family 4 n=1 Tax=Aeromicrobium choanae TaxID=1736691 RepID=A0A1T4Z4R6_9ACTN|nr:glycosyltransferase [Aeromicrobium choanae]SKB09040.1 Glycosyltransferase Family 4 [Aeromicrobium choanae]